MQNVWLVRLAEEVEMDEKGIEVCDLPLPAIVGWERIGVVVGFIESGIEAAEEGRHGQVHASMAEVGRRVDEDRLVVVVAEEVAGP